MGDQALINVAFRDTCASVGEQELDRFAGLAIDGMWLLTRSGAFPFVDALANQGVNWFSVGGHRLVHRNIQEAHRVFWYNLPSFWHQQSFVLPPDTATADIHN